MSIREKIPFMGGSNAYDQLVEGLVSIKGDADALVLFPYDDGTYFIKPANFEKDLIGGQGGYETEDGDKIVMDGDGQPMRDLFGVPMLLAVDPTEHAAAVDPIKALMAQKNNIGEWLRVDSNGVVVESGPAVEPAPILADMEDVDEAWSSLSDDELLDLYIDDYDATEYSTKEKVELVTENEEGIREELERALTEAYNTTDGTAPVASDGGAVATASPKGSLVEDALNQRGVPIDQATDEQIYDVMKQLSERGELTKIYDIAPPGVAHVDGDGNTWVEEATHIAVDQSKAADLLPKTTSTTELNVAIDKARMEEHEEDKWKSIFIQGMIAGVVTAAFMGLFMGGLLALL